MKNCLLTYRSLTYAQKAAKILERARVYAAIVRTPQELTREGCGYALKVRECDMSKTLSLLKKESASPKKVFEVFPDGRIEGVSV